MDTDDLIENLIESDIFTYRLSDGSYIVAEEVSIVGDNRLLISFPSEIVSLEQVDDIALRQWDLFVSGELTELNPNSIISKTEASLSLKSHYFTFLAGYSADDEVSREIDEAYNILEQLNPIDKLEESIHTSRWSWNPELN